MTSPTGRKKPFALSLSKGAVTLALLLSTPAARAADAPPAAVVLAADPAQSALEVRAGRSGPFKALAHDHLFAVTQWRAEVRLDPSAPEQVSVEVVADASSLHDQITTFGEKIRGRIDREAAGPTALDAERWPEVRFEAEGATLASSKPDALEGVLHGRLTVRGQTRPQDLPFRAWRDGGSWRATGEAHFLQTAFGITPATVAGGAIRVEDELTVSLRLLLRPASGAASLQARRPLADPAPAPQANQAKP